MPSDTASQQGRPGQARPGAVVLAYAVFAAAWILLSDKAVEWLYSTPTDYTVANILKGWLFVAVTSLLLSLLLRRLAGDAAGGKRGAHARFRLTLPLALVAVAIVVLTGAGIAHTVSLQKETDIARMQAIADLKSRQISDWLRERRADAEFVQTSVFYAEQYRRWHDDGDAVSGEQLQARLEHFIRNRGFSAVAVLDTKGRQLWGTAAPPEEPAPALRSAVESAARDRQVHRAGPYLDLAEHARVDFVAPLSATTGEVPFVVLRCDPADWLYATLQTWPVPSASGETLLFRRDGDHVLFLNELRHRQDTAVKLRMPVGHEELLAAQVLRGVARPDRVLVGRDYRDVPALGVMRTIPGTDWFLLAKMDRSEVYNQAVKDAAWIGLAGLLALFMAGAGLVMLRQREQLTIADSIQQSQSERLHALHLLAAIAESSDDAIFAKDLEGRYLLFNRAACRFVGKPVEDVLGHDDRAIFPAEKAELLVAIGRRVIAENRIHTQEQVLDTPDGERVFLATKGPLHDADGKVMGIFGISRDITERKRAEVELTRLGDDMSATLQAIPDLLFELDEAGRYLAVKATQERLLAAPTAQLVGHTVREKLPPGAAQTVMDALAEAAQTGTDYGRTITLPLGDGPHTFELSVASKPETDGSARRFIVLSRDITARTAAAEALNRQTEELRTRNEELERFNRATVGRELDMIALKRQVNELSRQLGQEPPYSLAFLDRPAQPA